MNLLRLLPRFQRAQRELGTLEARERWSRVEIADHQLERLNRLWAHAIEYVPYYRELAVTWTLPNRFSSLEEFQAEVPLLGKDTVQARQKDFISAKAGRGQWQFTGGSTGAPCPFLLSQRAHHEMLRSRYRFHAMWGLGLHDRWAFLWGHALSRPTGLAGRLERLRQPFKDRLRNRIRLSAYRTQPEDLRQHLKRIAAFRPVAIYAYSTVAYLLAREAEAIGFRCDSLKLVVLTSEPAFPHIVQTCERAFGVPAVVEYGAAECSVMAVEWPDRTLRVREDNVLIETAPREDGRYDILVTVLNNPSFPLLRYAIGDVTDSAIRHPDHGFAILENIVGRDNDLVFSRSGQPLHGTLFERILEDYASVRRYRMHQHASGELAVTVELTHPGAELELRQIERTLVEHVGYLARAEIVDALQVTPAGKHRWITSELAQAPTRTPRRDPAPCVPHPGRGT